MGQDGGRWLSVRTRTGEEFEVEAGLRTGGFDVFLPWQMVERRIHRRGLISVRSERVARFTGYIFGFVDAQHSVWRMRKTDGVIQIASRGDAVLPVADRVMARLREACTWDGYWPPEREVVAEVIGPRIGEVVMIPDGPFAGFPGEVERVDITRGVMVLSVSIFGRSTSVECPLSPAEAREPAIAG